MTRYYMTVISGLVFTLCVFNFSANAQIKQGKSTSEVTIVGKQVDIKIKQVNSFQGGIAYWVYDKNNTNDLVILTKDSSFSCRMSFKKFLVDASGKLIVITKADSVFSSLDGIAWVNEGTYEESKIYLEKGILTHDENCFTYINYSRFINSYIRYNFLTKTVETYIDADSVNKRMYVQRVLGLMKGVGRGGLEQTLIAAEEEYPQDVFFLKHYAVQKNKPNIFWQSDKYVVLSFGQEYCELRDLSYKLIKQTSLTSFLKGKKFHNVFFQDRISEKIYLFIFINFQWVLYEFYTSDSTFHQIMKLPRVDIERVAIYGGKVYYCRKRGNSLNVLKIESEAV